MLKKHTKDVLKILIPILLVAALVVTICFITLKPKKRLQIDAKDFSIVEGETKILDNSIVTVSNPYATIMFEVDKPQVLQKDGFSVTGLQEGKAMLTFFAKLNQMEASCSCYVTVIKRSSENPDENGEDEDKNGEDENGGGEDSKNDGSDAGEENADGNGGSSGNGGGEGSASGDAGTGSGGSGESLKKPDLEVFNLFNCEYSSADNSLIVERNQTAGFGLFCKNLQELDIQTLLDNCDVSPCINLWIENAMFFFQATAAGQIKFNLGGQQEFVLFVKLKSVQQTPPNQNENQGNQSGNQAENQNGNEAENQGGNQGGNVSGNLGGNQDETQDNNNSGNEAQGNNNLQNPDPQIFQLEYYIYNEINCSFDSLNKVLNVAAGKECLFCLGCDSFEIVDFEMLIENCVADEAIAIKIVDLPMMGSVFSLTATKSGVVIFNISQTTQIKIVVEVL